MRWSWTRSALPSSRGVAEHASCSLLCSRIRKDALQPRPPAAKGQTQSGKQGRAQESTPQTEKLFRSEMFKGTYIRPRLAKLLGARLPVKQVVVGSARQDEPAGQQSGDRSADSHAMFPMRNQNTPYSYNRRLCTVTNMLVCCFSSSFLQYRRPASSSWAMVPFSMSMSEAVWSSAAAMASFECATTAG